MKFSESPVKCLGIYVGYDNEKCEKLNWNNKIIKRKLLSGYGKNMTVFSKVMVVNILCFSKLIYNSMLLPVSEAII